MNVTYLLGAGASYFSVPIINDLQKQMEAIPTRVTKQKHPYDLSDSFIYYKKGKTNTIIESNKLLFDFLDALEKTGKYSKEYNTIDTYALYNKYYYPEEYIKIKQLLNTFFSFWQSVDQNSYITEDDINKIRRWEKIDHRYIGLISSFINLEQNKKVIPDNINFITWNYDTQLERAISLFYPKGDNNLMKVCQENYVYPICDIDKAKVIHLNGISGFEKLDGKLELVDICSHDRYATLNACADHFNEKKYTDNTLLDFSWDIENENFNKKIQRCREIMNQTDVLIIIGYSFPQFNRVIDLDLYNNLHKTTKIVVQNPMLNESIFHDYFGNGFKEHSRVGKVLQFKDASQFFVPGEIFGKLSIPIASGSVI